MNFSSTLRTILFWLSIVLLGVMLWKLVSSNGERARNGEEPSYSLFMAKVDAGEVKEVTMYLSSNSYELQGEYSKPANQRFHLTIPKENAPEVTKALREQSIQVVVKEVRSGDWVLILLNAAPLILLVGFCLFLMRQMQSRGRAALGRPAATRTGIGYDLHRLEEGRPLIVGGIELPFDKGPAGHSDGDVLAHAICDALLGAAGLGDIGTHFPDSDPKWKDANSLLFLEHAKKLLEEKKLAIEHVDAVVILEKPKLGPHFPKMREALAKSLGVPVEKIHLKAKTNEGVDAIGRGEAIAAHVVATLVSR